MLEDLFTDTERTLCVDSRIDQPELPYAPLFFYHVPKTGGLSFYIALRSAIGFANKYEDRLGALGTETEVQRIDDAVPHRRLFQAGYALIASHHAFGFHRKFRQPFVLTTIVRDPLGRVRSEYTYTSMRRQRPVSAAGFQASFRAEENINRAVKQLAGQARLDQPAAPELYRRAEENLERYFESYVTHHHIARLIGFYLSRYRLPNVVMERINTTSPAYRLDAEPWRDEIETLNQQDLRLYEIVRSRPRLPVPMPPPLPPRSHPTTVMVNETGNVEQSEVLVIGVDSERLAALIRHNRGQASGLIIPVEALMCRSGMCRSGMCRSGTDG
jgi:hypothetical protein